MKCVKIFYCPDLSEAILFSAQILNPGLLNSDFLNCFVFDIVVIQAKSQITPNGRCMIS